MCAIEAGKRQRSVMIVDHANKVGKKILMSGGGRCNFTNYFVTPENFISHNPHFCKSALSRYTQWDFIKLVEQYKIRYHEKTLGQLFCDEKSKDIVNMLVSECEHYHVAIQLNSSVLFVKKTDTGFVVQLNHGTISCSSLVIATGGLSIPTIGASPFGYKIAEQFGIKIWPTRAGLVPFTLHDHDKTILSPLSGVATRVTLSNHLIEFTENMLFTHRGISGPAALQLSSFWQPGEAIHINLLPDFDFTTEFLQAQQSRPKIMLKTWLSEQLPKRLIDVIIDEVLGTTPLFELTSKSLTTIAQQLNAWQIKPNATEGYRTAEVTLGGVDCDALSSKTFEAVHTRGLYFIGEVIDVSGWLGGYNFQWAWSSGWAAGQVV